MTNRPGMAAPTGLTVTASEDVSQAAVNVAGNATTSDPAPSSVPVPAMTCAADSAETSGA